VLTGAAGTGAVAAATVVKNLVSRARPASVWQLVAETGYSFPSRHATVATALLLITAYLLAGRTHRQIVVAAPVGGRDDAAGLVAASRVYLGVNRATDVTDAAGLGAAWSLTLITAHLLLRRRSAKGKPGDARNLA
jgi:undecaprenyl-diphosphatase